MNTLDLRALDIGTLVSTKRGCVFIKFASVDRSWCKDETGIWYHHCNTMGNICANYSDEVLFSDQEIASKHVKRFYEMHYEEIDF